ncbi:HNH endonuclease signature motif containing protein [Castellaniella hirudinis]|uniref:HNH endonuclease signature motif containing protein n=1 Tax=Castellaniella hirudinis TaxID=1144617 RepID=UPI0039C05D8B
MARLQTIPSRLGKLPAKRQQAQGNLDSWRGGKTSAQRGYGYKWQQARAGYLAKHPHCVMCLADLDMTDLPPADVIVECAKRGVAEPLATIVDHRIPHRGDQALFWDRSNWQGLCKTHHDSTKQRIERGSQRQAIGLDGWPVED